MQNRRSFLTKLIAGGSFFSFLFFSKNSNATPIKMENILIHHVYFWLKDPQNIEVRNKFEQGLKDLVKVPTIHQSHLGVPASTESRDVVDHSYTYSLVNIFKTKADQDIYQKHPIHLKFVEENKDLWSKVVVYDSVDI